MCTVCGCGEGEARIVDHADDHHGHDSESGPIAGHAHDHSHSHHHDHDHVEAGGDHHDYGRGPARAHAPGLTQARMVSIEKNILEKNDEYAAANRRLLNDRGILALNLVSSPGSGKTTLLTRTICDLAARFSVSVIEGDQQTDNDAERIRATGARAVQINTGKGCHLDGHMVGHAIESLNPAAASVLFIENVGNLVCPAAFDLGEACKVAILSVTEGEDKPIKYPDMFHAAELMLLNKIDLLPHLDFDAERCEEYARRVNPNIKVLRVSAKSGEGMDHWYRWIAARRELLLAGHPLAGAREAV